MSKIPGFAKRVSCLFLILLLPGCAKWQTYEDSKYQFTEPLAVLVDQPGWVTPGVLEIYEISSRGEICKICNTKEERGKGSHFKIFGLHRPTLQDMGCYMTNDDLSVGRVYYLAGDLTAKSHELAHHFHGPRHANPRPWLRWPQLHTGGNSYAVAATGSRIARTRKGR